MHPVLSLLCNLRFQHVDIILPAEEFNEALLEHVSTIWTPAYDFIAGTCTVDCGLRADSPPSTVRQFLKVRQNSQRFRRQWSK